MKRSGWGRDRAAPDTIAPMPPQPFLLTVGDLLSRPGTHRRLDIEAPLDAGTTHAHVAPGRSVRVDVVLDSVSDGIVARGEVELEAHLTCNRCLTEWDETETVQFTQLFGREADEDGYGIVNDTIDLEDPIRDEVALGFPLAPLCRSECRGLCATCGADLNEGPCDGHPSPSTSPFARLADMLGAEDR